MGIGGTETIIYQPPDVMTSKRTRDTRPRWTEDERGFLVSCYQKYSELPNKWPLIERAWAKQFPTNPRVVWSLQSQWSAMQKKLPPRANNLADKAAKERPAKKQKRPSLQQAQPPSTSENEVSFILGSFLLKLWKNLQSPRLWSHVILTCLLPSCSGGHQNRSKSLRSIGRKNVMSTPLTIYTGWSLRVWLSWLI